MSNLAISIVFWISGLLCVAWMALTIIQAAKKRKGIEREIYLEQLEKTAQENEQEIAKAEQLEQTKEQKTMQDAGE